MTTEDRLRALVARELDVPAERLTPEATLEDLEVDSLRMIEMVFAIEEAFGVSVGADTAQLMARIRTFGDLTAYVEGLAAAPGNAEQTHA